MVGTFMFLKWWGRNIEVSELTEEEWEEIAKAREEKAKEEKQV